MNVGRQATVLETHGLTKLYDGRRAVDDLDLTVRQGEIYGFLGRNGAGKTTTICMMLSLVRPTAGWVEILGARATPSRSEIYARVGSMIGAPGFYGNLSVFDNLAVHGRLVGLRGTGRIREVLELVGLAGEAERRARSLSTGMKQRLGLARALLAEPEILILDEPTNGLDPIGIKDVRLLIKRLAEERHITVFMSSHILSEVQQLATRVGIIHRGRLVEEIDLEELRRRSRTYLEVKVSDPPRAVWVLEDKLGLRDFSVHEENRVRVYEKLDRAAEINRALNENGVLVGRLFVSEENLEDHFIKLRGGEDIDVAGAAD